MQSKLASTALKLNRLVSSNAHQNQKLLFLGQKIGFATSTGRTADPALHSEDPEEVGVTEAIIDVKQRQQSTENGPTTKNDDPYVHPKSPIESAPKLDNPNALGPKTDPIAQQKRRISSAALMDDVICAGIDLSPWPADDREIDRKKQREEQEEDNREYFKHHKASPLSEIEIADTRKPITRAIDEGTAKTDSMGYEAGEVIVWRPEQVDTAEDSLRRATEIFKMNAMRGDPDSPHGRVLRELRGEYW